METVMENVKMTGCSTMYIAQAKGPGDEFVLVEAENLSTRDKFMKHVPKTERERVVKWLIEEAIRKKVKNFYRPKYDPAFTDDRKGICFEPGKMPALGKSYDWWEEVALKYNPEWNSRLGTKLQYGAFLGFFIKRLVSNGYDVAWAWHAVCNNSRELGHYWNSDNAKRGFEYTGSREICGFCDLANTFKVLARDKEAGGFWMAGGYANGFSYYIPIADIELNIHRCADYGSTVGWIVLSGENDEITR